MRPSLVLHPLRTTVRAVQTRLSQKRRELAFTTPTTPQLLPSLFLLHHDTLDVLTAGTLERASIMVRHVGFNAVKPHLRAAVRTARAVDKRSDRIKRIRQWH